jgi:hypothetical protein
MKKNQSYLLIEGAFDCQDAKKILINLINAKIKYHQLRLLSLDEQAGYFDEVSHRRIKELKETRDEILSMLEEASRDNLKLQIHSEIQIKLEGTGAKKSNRKMQLEVA